MFRARGGAAIAGKAGYALGCIAACLVLVSSGFAYYVKSQVDSIGGSGVISSPVSSATIAPMNILLMGLESRTYWSGQPLPKSLEDAMHIGSLGGDATNTLILIHIFAGGQKAVGFSIPRDDWVNMVGTGGYGGAQGKIDQAYGFAMANKENQLAGSHMTQGEIAWQGNEAGRLAEIQTVEALTGVHIDHFAELNLEGFYRLAQVFGGIEVCLNDRAYDPTYSGANIPPGYHLLNASQALAFVRQRHNLPNGDLDRTHRQQAVIDYVIWKLEHEGVFTDLGQLSQLLTVAKQYLITDQSWNLLDFLSDMKALTGENLTFTTLPITGYETVDGQDANAVNTAYTKQVVHNTFYPPAPKPAPKTTAKSASTPATVPASQPAPAPASSSPSASESNGQNGGAVTVTQNAPYGIPCVD
jgi:LCP family protein required for cell wall assembly